MLPSGTAILFWDLVFILYLHIFVKNGSVTSHDLQCTHGCTDSYHWSYILPLPLPSAIFTLPQRKSFQFPQSPHTHIQPVPPALQQLLSPYDMVESGASSRLPWLPFPLHLRGESSKPLKCTLKRRGARRNTEHRSLLLGHLMWRENKESCCFFELPVEQER